MTSPIMDFGWDKTNVTAETLVKTGACKLHGITLNGVTTVGDVLVYDGVDAGGTLIATLNIRVAVSVSYQGISWNYDCKMDTGIFLTFATFVGNLTVMHY